MKVANGRKAMPDHRPSVLTRLLMKSLVLKLAAACAYVAMVAVNYLSNALPINGRTPAQVSDHYGNLFAPAGFAFSIWGPIYLLLGGYVAFQFTKRGRTMGELFERANVLFIATSVANVSWIFAWHYDFIGLSMLAMLALIVLLVAVSEVVRDAGPGLLEKAFVRLPFSIYFGWISVATIANFAAYLVSVGWSGFGIPDSVWTSAMLLVGFVIGASRMFKNRDAAYGLVFVWAYFGILFKHVSATGFDGRFPLVIATVSVCLLYLALAVGALLLRARVRTLKTGKPAHVSGPTS